MLADLHYLSLDEVARRLKARKVSSVDTTRAILDRIAKLDPRLKSYATLTPERALADAAARDAEIAAGKSRGPLHGVPIAVKDLCNTAGIATAAGMAIHRANVPARDATVVARLKAAGAVILGKLQMTEGAFGTHHPSIPPPINPWNAAYWSGASSSGSGVATAAGLCFASLGSDTGGSIRFPSTVSGLSGLKPTWGRVSRAGVFALAESLDHVGPRPRCLCRSPTTRARSAPARAADASACRRTCVISTTTCGAFSSGPPRCSPGWGPSWSRSRCRQISTMAAATGCRFARSRPRSPMRRPIPRAPRNTARSSPT